MSIPKHELLYINNERQKQNLPPLNTKGEVKKQLGRPRIDPELLKKPQRKSVYLNFHCDEPKPAIQRPPTKYDNASYQDIYNKYGL